MTSHIALERAKSDYQLKRTSYNQNPTNANLDAYKAACERLKREAEKVVYASRV